MVDLDATRGPAADPSASREADALFLRAEALVAASRLDDAAPLYARAADAGHVQARVQQARLWLFGMLGPAEPAAAIEELRLAESAGDAGAGCLLASIALGGIALTRDGNIDARLRAAVEARHAPALLAAAIHFGRKSDPGDQALCLRMLGDAANAGHATAAALLAERLANGEGTAADPVAAAALRGQLAAHGIPPLPACSALPPFEAPAPPRQLAFAAESRAMPRSVLSTRPAIAVIEGLLSRDECRLLMASAQPYLRASRTVDPATGRPAAMPLRTSSDASFDPVAEDFALRCVQWRIARAAGAELVDAERLIVLRYEPGQEYRPHRDYLPPATIARDRPHAGNRARTICVYLNDVEDGGETVFPGAGVEIAPRAGTAVVFDNLLADGTPDPESLHAGNPVRRGVKWLATLWLRQRRYRDF